jgi:hypothetical protein
MGCQARLRAEQYFDWSVAVSRLDHLYREQLSSASVPDHPRAGVLD